MRGARVGGATPVLSDLAPSEWKSSILLNKGSGGCRLHFQRAVIEPYLNVPSGEVIDEAFGEMSCSNGAAVCLEANASRQ